ncbi:MAG: L-seryl-tRNA(Sec) selenium transferase [Gammaproteobacteria bacterium]|nr:L-seryl-tRNA(Sec) selenium transferase [Gammaproteobacteria bacterium]
MSRRLPSVDQVLTHGSTEAVVRQWGLATTKEAVRAVQAKLRVAGDIPEWGTEPGGYADALSRWLDAEVGHGYETVFNLTGTIIHTNLGRALISPETIANAMAKATRPTTLEYDLAKGSRGERERIVRHRLKLSTGAEAATVVNNNAAAVLLVLNTLALGRAVAVSRGELIEIGGSFRLPEIMQRAGCKLAEVGTTNRTHPRDFEAVAANAALLLKVHPSNYHVEGFTREVTASGLAAIGKQHDVPTCVDLGSGALIDLARLGLPGEPTVRATLASGVDLVTFSGDKLLGGVQAGLIVGDKDLVEALDRNPLKRALRLDKLTLALLDDTLKAYEDPTTLPERIPLLRTLTTPMAELARRGEAVVECLLALPSVHATLEKAEAQIGSGAVPDRLLPSRAVRVRRDGDTADTLAAAMRQLSTPVVARVASDSVWLDMHGAEPLDELLQALAGLGRQNP